MTETRKKPKSSSRDSAKPKNSRGYTASPERELLFKKACATQAKKRLGQNFLIEPTALQKIAAAADLKPGDTIVEIGPGLGFLTRYLVETGAHVVAVELDRDMVEELQELKTKSPNLTILHKDFLSLDLNEIKGERLKVIGNVPYQITSPIIAHVFGEIGRPAPWFDRIDSLTMMVQKELAWRISAEPGTKAYGMLTLLARYFSEARYLFDVNKEEFIPMPNVDSAVVQMTRLAQPPIPISDPELLRKIIIEGFKGRRKMMRNTLGFTHLSEDEIVTLLSGLRISPAARVENLTLETLAEICTAVGAKSK